MPTALSMFLQLMCLTEFDHVRCWTSMEDFGLKIEHQHSNIS
jgi:hypothetical protein